MESLRSPQSAALCNTGFVDEQDLQRYSRGGIFCLHGLVFHAVWMGIHIRL